LPTASKPACRGRLAFDAVPANLRDRPTLSVLLEAAGGKQSVELSYLTGGLAWKADYVANLSADGRSLDLNGWVTLTNRSGAGFDDATLQLVAGTVNRVRQQDSRVYAMAAPAPARAKAAEATQEALMDYHLYSFERPTSIADNQTKQIALLSAGAVPVRREYLLAGNEYYYRDRHGQIGQKLKPAVFLEFENKGGQLGKPLPAGIVRVYAKDSKGAAQFVGRRPHRAHGEERADQAAAGRSLRHHRRAQADELQAHRRQPDRVVLAHRTAQRQGRGRDGQGAGAAARRLGDGAGITEAQQRVGARRLVECRSAGGREHRAGLCGAREVVTI
jgi:hypothetical protein